MAIRDVAEVRITCDANPCEKFLDVKISKTRELMGKYWTPSEVARQALSHGWFAHKNLSVYCPQHKKEMVEIYQQYQQQRLKGQPFT
jgi:hypothetical protein